MSSTSISSSAGSSPSVSPSASAARGLSASTGGTGAASFGDFWRQGTDEGLEVTTLTVEVDGNLGYLVGRYNLPATDEEPADSGKYVMCLKRQRDGSWKLTADIWNRSGDDDEADDEESTPGPSIS